MERSPFAIARFTEDPRATASEAASLSLAPAVIVQPDPESLITSCANCGARMLDRKCKLICEACGNINKSCADL